MSVRDWCTDNKDTISAVGVAIAAVGFVATTIALALTSCQIRESRVVLQSTNAYQIQKDARELVETLLEQTIALNKTDSIKFKDYLASSSQDTIRKYEQEAVHAIGQMFNFYLSVYRQSKNKGISPDFAKAFAADFCQVYKTPSVQNYWMGRVQSRNPPSKSLQEMRNDWCS